MIQVLLLKDMKEIKVLKIEEEVVEEEIESKVSGKEVFREGMMRRVRGLGMIRK